MKNPERIKMLMDISKIKKIIKICPYKEENTREVYEQYCKKYNCKCYDVIQGQQCERFKRIMIEEINKIKF